MGPATTMSFEFVKEMPKPETEWRLDFASILGALFFTWVIIQLFPVSGYYSVHIVTNGRFLSLSQLDKLQFNSNAS